MSVKRLKELAAINEAKVDPKHKKLFYQYAKEILENLKKQGYHIGKDDTTTQSVIGIFQKMSQFQRAKMPQEYKRVLPKNYDEVLFTNGDKNTYDSVYWSMTDAQQYTIVKKALFGFDLDEELNRMKNLSGINEETGGVDKNKLKDQLEKYLDKLKAYHDADYKKNYDRLEPPTFTTMWGKKFIRVVRVQPHSKAVHCFVDMEGNIFKAAGWAAPAKGIRGSIFDPKPPLDGREFYR